MGDLGPLLQYDNLGAVIQDVYGQKPAAVHRELTELGYVYQMSAD